MEKVFEAVERIPEQFRYLVVAGVAILLVLGYYTLLRMPAEDDLKRQQRVYADVNKQYVEKKRIADNLQFWQLEVQRLEGQLKEALSKLPTQVEAEELLVNLPNIAKKNAMTVSQFEMKGEVNRQGYAEVPMELQMTGTFRGIGGFAQEVGDQPRIMSVRTVELAPAGRGRGGADAPQVRATSDFDEDGEEGASEMAEGQQLQIKAEVLTYRFLETSAAPAAQQRRRGR